MAGKMVKPDNLLLACLEALPREGQRRLTAMVWKKIIGSKEMLLDLAVELIRDLRQTKDRALRDQLNIAYFPDSFPWKKFMGRKRWTSNVIRNALAGRRQPQEIIGTIIGLAHLAMLLPVSLGEEAKKKPSAKPKARKPRKKPARKPAPKRRVRRVGPKAKAKRKIKHHPGKGTIPRRLIKKAIKKTIERRVVAPDTDDSLEGPQMIRFARAFRKKYHGVAGENLAQALARSFIIARGTAGNLEITEAAAWSDLMVKSDIPKKEINPGYFYQWPVSSKVRPWLEKKPGKKTVKPKAEAKRKIKLQPATGKGTVSRRKMRKAIKKAVAGGKITVPGMIRKMLGHEPTAAEMEELRNHAGSLRLLAEELNEVFGGKATAGSVSVYLAFLRKKAGGSGKNKEKLAVKAASTKVTGSKKDSASGPAEGSCLTGEPEVA